MQIVVIGAGPSGIHFAATALERGHDVTLIDTGTTPPDIPLADLDFAALKENHPDPVRYFLGDRYGSVQLPDPDPEHAREYYGLPASKDHVFHRTPRFRMTADGISPLVSFAAGGLAECWTGGVYAFNDDDLKAFGFGYDRLAPHYAHIAARIGIGGSADDLAGWYPCHDSMSAPVPLDQSSAVLFQRYQDRRNRLMARHPGIRLGRSRQAALSHPLGNREACTQCGRCLWGCPNGAFYTPSLTLAECRKNPRLRYLNQRFASHFALAQDGLIDALIAYPDTGPEERITADAFVLGCGTISSANLFLRTLYKARGEIARLGGLMDNQQVLAPFLNLAMLGRAYDPASYQYHQLAIGLEAPDPARFVHCQVTTMTTASAHPVIGQIPLGMRAARQVFTTLRSALGVVNLNFSDTRRPGNYITLNPKDMDNENWPGLALRYRSPDDQDSEITAALFRLRKFMRGLGAPLVPGMTQIRTPGASVHYSGTLPISPAGGEFTVNEFCQSNDFANLFVIDGSVFPALPAKNLTFTLMANASRVAHEVF